MEAAALAAVSTLGSGTRAIGVYEQRWLPAPAGPLCVYLHGVGDPGQRRHGAARRAGVRGVVCGAWARLRRPVLAEGGAGEHGRDLRGRAGAGNGTDVRRLPGERVALVAGAGEPLAELPARLAGSTALTLLMGAEREGLPEEVVGACERVAHIPIATESLNAAMAATVALYEMTRGLQCPPDRRMRGA